MRANLWCTFNAWRLFSVLISLCWEADCVFFSTSAHWWIPLFLIHLNWQILKGEIREQSLLPLPQCIVPDFPSIQFSNLEYFWFWINIVQAKGYRLRFKFSSFYTCLQRPQDWVLSRDSPTCQNVMFACTLAKVAILDAWFFLPLFHMRLVTNFTPLGNRLWGWINI